MANLPVPRLSGWRTDAFLLALGAIAALGQAPTGWFWATLLALPAAIRVVDLSRRWSAFRHGFAFGFGYFAVSLRWIVSPFLVEPEVFGWMAPFALILMAAGGALFWALAALLTVRLRGGTLLFALMIAGAEVLRSLILTGFPWALLGHIWIDTPVVHLAAWAGPHALTLLTVLVAWSLAKIMDDGRHAIPLVAVLAVAAVPFLQLQRIEIPADAPVVRLVQPNAPQDEKWDIDKRDLFFDRMIGFTQADAVPDLIVWPETALPQLLEYAQPQIDLITAAARGAPVITGANRSDGPRYFNTFAVIDGEGFISALYDKAHLVPFGEYIPFGEWLGGIGILGVAPSDGAGFTAGTANNLIEIPGIGPARPLICYEGIFAEEIGTDERPRLMVLITNDAWFGPRAGPSQHLAQARLRSIEQGLPMVRVANTGISAMIDAHGRVTGQMGMNTAGYLDLPLPPALPPTPYGKYGDWPVIILLVLTIGAVATRGRFIND